MKKHYIEKPKTYSDLRGYVQKLDKFPGCEIRARAPLFHEGFPGTFNLSFTEYDWLKDYGGFSNFNYDSIVSTIQSCIRSQDILEHIKYHNIRNNNELRKYLGVFEMADLAGQVVLSGKRQTEGYTPEEIHTYKIKQLVDTLTGLGLETSRIFPTYHVGGEIGVITNGKYNLDSKFKIIPADVCSMDGFIRAGIPPENLISDRTRDTFLSLHLNQKTPWGYRNEINYNIGSNEKPILLDIGTLERCLWFPVYNGKETAENIVSLNDIPHTISVGGLGLERLWMAVEGLDDITKVDYIKQFYDVFRAEAPSLTDDQRYRAGEVIRTLHRIYSDCNSYELKLSQNRDKKVRKFLQILRDNIGDVLNRKNLESLLAANTYAQPWHSNLGAGELPTSDRIMNYLHSKN